MINYEESIGRNIKAVRLERNKSQEVLARACDISNTTLSAYETGRKIPSLPTIAKIAKKLNVSIERLYYGDENNTFIISEPDVGKKVVNSVYYLWKEGIVSYSEKDVVAIDKQCNPKMKGDSACFLRINDFGEPIKRLITSLNEFELKKDTYYNQDEYIEILLASVAKEINIILDKREKYAHVREEIIASSRSSFSNLR